MAACEDEPDKYEVAGESPAKYVRVPDPAAADSLLTGLIWRIRFVWSVKSAECLRALFQ